MKFGFGIVGIPKRGRGPLVKPAPGAVIDWQHPLTQGMVLGLPFLGPPSRLPSDAVKGVTGTSLNVVEWSGPALRCYNGPTPPSVSYSVIGSTVSGTNPFSAVARFSITNTSSWRTWFAINNWSPQFYATNRRLGAIYGTGTSFTGAFDLPLNEIFAASYVRYSVDAGQTKAWVNQRYYGHATFAHSIATPTNYRIGWSGFATEHLDGDVECLYLYNRALPESDILRVHADPYSMFWLPGARRIFLPLTRRGLQLYRDYVSISKYNLNGDKIILRKYDPTKSNDMIVLK